MSRLAFIATLLLALSTAERVSRVPYTANDFIAEDVEWARLRNETLKKPGTIDAAEIRQWTILKRRWRDLERVVEAER